MEYRNLGGTNLKASVLGFGCAGILGSVGARKSRRGLDAAFDQGITYFDVARSYGFGAAEGFVGKFLLGKRGEICLASKFGINPPRRSALIDRLRPILRPAVKALRRLAPSAHQSVRQHAGGLSSRRQFSLEDARGSLEQSLRELQTDHLDVWLLHDCGADVAEDDALFEFLDQCVAAGKIRYYGAASGAEDVAAVVRRRTGATIAQFANSPAGDATHRFDNPRGVAVNTHSPFGRGSLRESLAKFLAADSDMAKKCSSMLGLNLLSPEGIDAFLLQFSLSANRTGVVICGMSNPRHIRANCAIAGAASSPNIEKVAAELRQRDAFAS